MINGSVISKRLIAYYIYLIFLFYVPNKLPVIITTKETGWRETSDFPEALIVQRVNSLTNLFVLDKTFIFFFFTFRSEERRVGKECCR